MVVVESLDWVVLDLLPFPDLAGWWLGRTCRRRGYRLFLHSGVVVLLVLRSCSSIGHCCMAVPQWSTLHCTSMLLLLLLMLLSMMPLLVLALLHAIRGGQRAVALASTVHRRRPRRLILRVGIDMIAEQETCSIFQSGRVEVATTTKKVK